MDDGCQPMMQRACRSVGIDLGTTYSSLAYVDTQMMPRVVADSSGQTVMPSVVYFSDDGIIAGEMALGQAKVAADRVVQFIKVHMGEPWRRELGGRVHSPESISAMIVGQLVKEAEPQIGPIPSAVITVPAYFTEKRRRATQQAGEIAGLKVIGTLNEPMAATLAYGLHHQGVEQNAVVYDLGGGTFDVTVVRIAPNELEELATNGNRQLGGRDWDQALIDFVADDFKKAHGLDPREIPQALQDLVLECEAAKRRLGRLSKTTVRLHAAGRDHQVEISREAFEEMTDHLLRATKLTTEIALADAGLTWQKIARVVLVGGATHMPAVRRMIQQVSGKSPDTGVNPVLAVSLGAAVYAHMLETGHALKALQQKPRCEPQEGPPAEPEGLESPNVPPTILMPTESMPTVRFVTAHGVGVKVCSHAGWINRVLIPKNTTVPASVTRRFLTKASGRGGTEIKIELTQGDTTELAAAETLGTGRISGLPPDEPDGQPVDVTMRFDRQGRLQVHARYVPRKQQMEITLEIPDGLRQEEVAAHRQYLEDTGFLPQVEGRKLIEDLESDAFDEAGEADAFDEVLGVEELMQALGASEQDDLPTIEPVD